MRWALLLLLAVTPARAADGQAWQRLVGLLQYLEGDYPQAVAGHDEGELKEQLGFAQEAVDAARELNATDELPVLERIRERISRGEDPAGVARDCSESLHRIIAQRGLSQAPRTVPDLRNGERLFATACAACHGAKGDGDSVAAKTLEPKPANFHDPARLATLTPFRAFNGISFGIKGTAMPAFLSLTDAERWDLAFYLFTFAQPPCDHRPAATTLEELARSPNAALAQLHGDAEVACLRRTLAQPDSSGWQALTRSGVERAQALAAQGKASEARQALVDAYLTGLEPVEPLLRSRHPHYVKRLEGAFVRAREAAQTGEDFPAASHALLELLAAPPPAEGAGEAANFWTILLEALLIVLREGFEAVVVVGALLAVLKKMSATAQARLVHLGWVTALLSGAALYAFGRSILAGANREWMETLVSLGAVGLLLYAALWLNRRAVVSQQMGELRGQMQAALGQGGGLGLFVVAYTSVLRESVEAAIFLQGLGSDAPQATALGAAGGLLVLAILWGGIRAAGFALPMQTMFKASTVVLCLTAVSLLGKGVHGLQELGRLSVRPVAGPVLEVLGVFPDASSLGAQAALGALLLAVWLRSRQRR